MEEERCCKVCGKVLKLRDGERPANFKKRKTCNRACSSLVYKPKRKGSIEFYAGLNWGL